MKTAQRILNICESLSNVNEESLSRSLYVDLTDEKESSRKLGNRNTLESYLSSGDQVALLYSNATAEVVKVVSFERQPKGLPERMVKDFGNSLKFQDSKGSVRSMTLTESGRGMLIGVQLGMSARSLGPIDYQSVSPL